MKKEKLLLMGVDSSTRYALAYAKSLGVETVVTDYNSLNSCSEKQMSDTAWTIDVKDVDALVQRCKEEHVTGIYAGSNEFCVDKAIEVAQKLGMNYYASNEGWKCTRDKIRFKEYCIAAGLDVPKRYHLTSPFKTKDLQKIEYPVIVKPIDSCASQGLSFCRNEAELLQGYDKAMMHSISKQVMIEEFVDGVEMCAHYYVNHGKATLIGINDMYPITLNNRKTCSFVIMPSCYLKEYQMLNEKIEVLSDFMKCQDGPLLLQMIRRKNGVISFMESGYRVDGVGFWTMTEPLYGFNCVKASIDLALGHKLNFDLSNNHAENCSRVGAIYFLWANAGKINQIVGEEKAEKIDGVELVIKRFQVGHEIPKSDDVRQNAYCIKIIAKNSEEMIEKVTSINSILHIYDEKGCDLLIPYEDYDRLKKY